MKMSAEERDQIGRLTCRVEDRYGREEDGEESQDIKKLVAATRVLVALNEADELVIAELRALDDDDDDGVEYDSAGHMILDDDDDDEEVKPKKPRKKSKKRR